MTELGSLHAIRGAGLVRQVLKPSVVASLSATRAIGHVRYSTVAEEHPDNHQPICADTRLVRFRLRTTVTCATPKS